MEIVNKINIYKDSNMDIQIKFNVSSNSKLIMSKDYKYTMLNYSGDNAFNDVIQ